MGKQGKKYSTKTTAQKLEEAVDSKVKINRLETIFNMFFPPIIPIENLRKVHPWVKSLLSERIGSNLPLAGRLRHFLEAWEILTKDPKILEIEGFFSKISNTGESSSDATHGLGTSSSNTSGDREHVEEGSHTSNRASNWGVFK